MLKVYRSGVKTIQSSKYAFYKTLLELFNEDTYYKRISEALAAELSGLSALKLAERMHVNVVLMKEHIEIAEERGFVCRDESYEGVLWFNNKFN